jgi:antitoxin MazE
MQTQIGKWDNSLAVRIPDTLANDLNLRDGMHLDMTIVDGALVLRPSNQQHSLEELLERITPENVHAETDWGPPVGREMW